MEHEQKRHEKHEEERKQKQKQADERQSEQRFSLPGPTVRPLWFLALGFVLVLIGLVSNQEVILSASGPARDAFEKRRHRLQGA
jgi:hypothetical protein